MSAPSAKPGDIKVKTEDGFWAKPEDIKVKIGDDVLVHIIHIKNSSPYTAYVNTVRKAPLNFKWGEFLDPSKSTLRFPK